MAFRHAEISFIIKYCKSNQIKYKRQIVSYGMSSRRAVQRASLQGVQGMVCAG